MMGMRGIGIEVDFLGATSKAYTFKASVSVGFVKAEHIVREKTFDEAREAAKKGAVSLLVEILSGKRDGVLEPLYELTAQHKKDKRAAGEAEKAVAEGDQYAFSRPGDSETHPAFDKAPPEVTKVVAPRPLVRPPEPPAFLDAGKAMTKLQGMGITRKEVDAILAPVLLDKMPPDQLQQVVKQLQADLSPEEHGRIDAMIEDLSKEDRDQLYASWLYVHGRNWEGLGVHGRLKLWRAKETAKAAIEARPQKAEAQRKQEASDLVGNSDFDAAVSCKSCSALIRFGKTAKGSLMPLDAIGVSASIAGPGNPEKLFVYDAEKGVVRQNTLHVTRDGKPGSIKGYRAHWASCPGAAGHRKR